MVHYVLLLGVGSLFCFYCAWPRSLLLECSAPLRLWPRSSTSAEVWQLLKHLVEQLSCRRGRVVREYPTATLLRTGDGPDELARAHVVQAQGNLDLGFGRDGEMRTPFLPSDDATAQEVFGMDRRRELLKEHPVERARNHDPRGAHSLCHSIGSKHHQIATAGSQNGMEGVCRDTRNRRISEL